MSEPATSVPASKPKPLRRFLYFASGIAAGLLIEFLFFQTLTLPHPEGNTQIQPDINIGIEDVAIDGNGGFRSGSDYSEIEELLNQEKYDEALVMIEEKEGVLINYLKDLMNDSNLTENDRDYQMQVIKVKADELKLLRAQASVGLGREEEALMLLNDLRHSDGPYRAEAYLLYKQLIKEK